VIVNESSWHCKLYKFAVTSDEFQKGSTVCGYWSVVFVRLPLMLAFMAVLTPFFPIMWALDKIEAKIKGKTFCPFGKVVINRAGEGEKR